MTAAPASGTLLPWRRRADIVPRSRRSAGSTGWILKDPVALRYYTLREEEYFVWSRLNGRVVAEALCQLFAEQFAPQRLTIEELQRFVGQLAAHGLVVADQLGSGGWTDQRRREQARWRRWTSINPLAIRFRGVDPDRLLSALVPWCGVLFSKTGVLLGTMLIVSAMLLWLTHADEFARRWPEELAQWSVRDLGSLAAVLAVVKIAHELGHGVACKRFGGEVHEIGVLLLVFTPCLYCNVSDAWLLPSKWQRMGVSAAGMWVEALLAALCGWLWWGSAPGWFHTACLQVVVVCAASTLVFNINPLLRYDGYFILADWLEVPNLQQQAWSEWRRQWSRWMLGISTPPPADLSPRWRFWLPWYALASFGYRMLVIGVILWMLHAWLEPQGLATVAHGIAVLTVAALLVGPAVHLQQRLTARRPGPRIGPRGMLRLLAAAVLLGLLLFAPLPARVQAPLLLQPAQAQGVYVTVEGYLEWIVPPGSFVSAGDAVARLSNPALAREIARLEGELQAARQLVEHLERRRLSDPQSGLQLPAAQKLAADLADRWQQRRTDEERLTLRAEQDGVVWPLPAQPRKVVTGRLSGWSDYPFDSKNLGCWLPAGTVLAQVGREQKVEAVVYLTPGDLARVEAGQRVQVLLEAVADRPLRGWLREISTEPASELSPATAARLRLPLLASATSEARLAGTWYAARVELVDAAVLPLSHAVGRAVIVTSPRSLAERMGTWLWETFPGWTTPPADAVPSR
uniref:HlyD family efflux transporter periplasmic adaptor subunit n=1 Tax=Schlesneria paludicola TaxID=360056 RepID=A0A7C4LLB9_9PLAN